MSTPSPPTKKHRGPSRPKTQLQRDVAKPPQRALDQALRRIEDAIGGREILLDTLHSAPTSDDQHRLVMALADPENDTRSLAKVCEVAGVGVGGLLQMFKEAHLAQAQVEAIIGIARKLPSVAGDAMERALPTQELCMRCDGSGQRLAGMNEAGVAVVGACLLCEGKGKIEVAPDHKRVVTALELGGLLKKEPMIQTTTIDARTQNAAFLGTEYLNQFQAAMDRVLYGEGRRKQEAQQAEVVVEAEVIPSEPPKT